LIRDILSMDETYGWISYTVEIVQGSTVDKTLKLRLDRDDLAEEQRLVLSGYTTFNLVVYRIVERADFRESHLRRSGWCRSKCMVVMTVITVRHELPPILQI
jgi:hypothetical protein